MTCQMKNTGHAHIISLEISNRFFKTTGTERFFSSACRQMLMQVSKYIKFWRPKRNVI
jgi:hypothetical protein